MLQTSGLFWLGVSALVQDQPLPPLGHMTAVSGLQLLLVELRLSAPASVPPLLAVVHAATSPPETTSAMVHVECRNVMSKTPCPPALQHTRGCLFVGRAATQDHARVTRHDATRRSERVTGA
jgi:hypothetical protein